MNKAIILFDEKTIINIPFIFSLMKRYTILLILLPIGIISTIFYYKSTQHPIYGIDVNFSTNMRAQSGGDSQSNPMAFFWGTGANYLTRNDVWAIVRSYDFLDLYARHVYAHPDFAKLNFNSLTEKKLKTTNIIFSSCKEDKECKIHLIKGLLPNLFALDNGITDFRYILKVNTLNPHTTLVLTEILTHILTEFRTNMLKKDAEGQITSFAALIESGRNEIKEKGGENILEKKESIEAHISDYKEMIKDNSNNIASEKRNMDSLQIHLGQNKKIFENINDPVELKKYGNYQNIKERLTMISATTASLTSRKNGKMSLENKSLLLQLQKEEKELRSELKKLGKIKKYIVGYEGLASGKEASHASTEFEYLLAKKRYVKLLEESKRLEEQLEFYIKEKGKIDQIFLKVGPEISSLKQLEEKMVSSKLLLSSIISDINFEQYEKDPYLFSKTSLPQIVGFSILYNFMIFFLLNIAFFLFDDRIYSEVELKSYFKEYEIIGQTPNFD